jgi:hypothetical protein
LLKNKESVISDGFRRNILRVVHPPSNADLFYGSGDICVRQMCGIDTLLADYVALNLNAEVL